MQFILNHLFFSNLNKKKDNLLSLYKLYIKIIIKIIINVNKLQNVYFNYKIFLIFQVKVWFQNRRMKWKRTKAGLVNESKKFNLS